MNADLRTRHMAQIEDASAIALYDMLCEACDSRATGMTDAEQVLVADVAMLEQLKQQLYADIKQRGVMTNFRNGRQHMILENKAVASVKSVMDQQRKHLAELRLTPNSQKSQLVPIKTDGFDEF